MIINIPVNIKLFGFTIVIIIFLAGCDFSHKHNGDAHDQGHDHDIAKEKDAHNHSECDSGHEDAVGGLDLDMEAEHPEDEIIFSLDQQKLVDFKTVTATKQQMRKSFPATGAIRASSYGQAIVTAPVTGYLAVQDTSFPKFGDRLKAGQIIVKIVPSLNGESDPATLELDFRRARSGYELAKKELVRVEALYNQSIVPEKRVQESRKEEQVAKAELNSAKQRLKQYQIQPEKNKGDTAHKVVTSPIDGILDGVYVTPGAYLQEGAAMFHVVNTDTLRLEVNVPEADVARLVNPQGAWFTVDGFKTPFQVDLAKGDRLIAVGSVIAPQTRTVPLVFEFPNKEKNLRVGMFARVHVITGDPVNSIAIPAAAVQAHNGMNVAYVQIHEDAFERRVVRLGIQDANFVEVKNGIHAGEKVVTAGAYLVQLAASGPAVAGHGHAH